MPWEDWSDVEDVVPHTSAWMRATSPSGAAAYENRVAWSGELGFGVRSPESGQTSDADADPQASFAENTKLFGHRGVPHGPTADSDHAHGEDVSSAADEAPAHDTHGGH
jgi:hypothetical protein